MMLLFLFLILQFIWLFLSLLSRKKKKKNLFFSLVRNHDLYLSLVYCLIDECCRFVSIRLLENLDGKEYQILRPM